MDKILTFLVISIFLSLFAIFQLFIMSPNRISVTRCLNQGTKTFIYNKDAYVQCRNDKETTIVCNEGVINKNGVLTCKESITTRKIRFPHIKVPNHDDNFIYLSENTILDSYEGLSLWPTYNVSNRKYYVTNCYYTSNTLTIETSQSSLIPTGFSWPRLDNNLAFRRLELIGMNDMTAVPDEKRQYYFTLTGSLEKLQLHDAIKTKREIPMMVHVDSKTSQEFTINWDKIDQNIMVLKNVIFTKEKTIKYNERIIDGGYIVMSIESKTNDQTSVLHIGSDISIYFDNIINPTLKFI